MPIPNTMTPTGETPMYIFYQTYCDGQLLKLIKDKSTGDLFFDADSLAIALGYPDAQTMLADKYAVEAIQEYALENGGHSIRRIDMNGNPVLP